MSTFLYLFDDQGGKGTMVQVVDLAVFGFILLLWFLLLNFIKFIIKSKSSFLLANYYKMLSNCVYLGRSLISMSFACLTFVDSFLNLKTLVNTINVKPVKYCSILVPFSKAT